MKQIALPLVGLLITSAMLMGCEKGTSETVSEKTISEPLNASTSASLSEEASIQILKNRLREHPNLFRNWIEGECIQYWSGERDTDYQVEIRENHDGDCSGDPHTAPLLAFFVIDKSTQGVSFNDYIEAGVLIPFEDYVAKIEEYPTGLRIK